MKRLSILLCLLCIGGSLLVAQEATTEAPAGDSIGVQEAPEEAQADVADAPVPPADEATAEPDDSEALEGNNASDDSSTAQDDLYVEDEEFIYKMNQKGDQFIKIGLMVDIPLRPTTTQLKVGGSGTLGYMRFLNSNLAVGGDASFAYMTTIGKNVFTCIPLMAKVMYQFTVGKFEIPLTLGIGGAFQNYLGDTYFGLIIKPEAGAFFRYSPNWSFGANVGWNLMPQWTKDSSYFGVIMDAGISARYHF